MKMFYFAGLNLNLVLFFLSFKNVLNDACKDESGNDAGSSYITGLSLDEAKQKCFSLSYSEKNSGACCYSTNGCVLETPGDDNCPKNTEVANNCGMAGVYQPQTSNICKEISLVQGYCCYVKLKKISDNSISASCIRTKKLNKKKNEATDQIITYVGNAYRIEGVECHGTSTKYFWLLIIITIMLL